MTGLPGRGRRPSWARPAAGIRLKLAAGTAGVAALFGLLVLGGVYRGVSSSLGEEIGRRGFTIAETLLESCQNLRLADDSFALQHLLRSALSRYDDVRYIFVRDGSGKVVSHTFGRGVPRGLVRANVLRPGERSRSGLIGTEEGLILDVAMAFPLEELGSIRVGMKTAGARRRVLAATMGWGAAAVAALVLGVGFVLWQTGRVSRRLERLAGAAEEVGRGNLTAAVPVEDDDELGRLAGAFNAMTADLRRSQDQLLKAGKLAAVGELAACVAHEINNPLNTMGVCAQSLVERLSEAGARLPGSLADLPKGLETIDREIRRCKRITSGLLQFTHPAEPSLAPVDLNALVLETLPLLEHRFTAARCAVERSLEPGLPPVSADRDQLKQALLNILHNAVDHIKEGGRVVVSTARRDGAALMRVSDDGAGIPPENLGRIFDLFFTTSKPGAGSGLGLAICQKIVAAHGGSIEVESEPGRGAVFTIVLPL